MSETIQGSTSYIYAYPGELVVQAKDDPWYGRTGVQMVGEGGSTAGSGYPIRVKDNAKPGDVFLVKYCDPYFDRVNNYNYKFLVVKVIERPDVVTGINPPVWYGMVDNKLYLSNTATEEASILWNGYYTDSKGSRTYGSISVEENVEEIVTQGSKFYPALKTGDSSSPFCTLWFRDNEKVTEVDVSKWALDDPRYASSEMNQAAFSNRTTNPVTFKVKSHMDAFPQDWDELPRFTVSRSGQLNIPSTYLDSVEHCIEYLSTYSSWTLKRPASNYVFANIKPTSEVPVADAILYAHAPDVESEYPSLFGLAPSTGQWYRKVSGTWQEGTLYKKISGEWKVQEG